MGLEKEKRPYRLVNEQKKRSQMILKPLVVGAEGVEPPTLCL